MRAAAQVFVPDLATLEVAADDARHLAEVLRLRRGEAVVACDGAGSWRTCRYTASADPSRLLEVDGELCREPASETAVVVGFAPVKGERPEWVVQKLTEVGVDCVALVRSARAVVRWDDRREARAVKRLRRVARQAAAQSRRAWLPEVVGVVSLAQLRALVAPGVLALAEPGADPPACATTAVAVGPEGGWEESELDCADLLVGLGPGILRAETAAVAAGLLMCALRDGAMAPRLAAGTVAGPAARDDREQGACNHHAE
ncbi:MAG: RsmE family RNA methyltransferase [Acidimicrobiales bacterium]